jgi:putative serine protease PepD
MGWTVKISKAADIIRWLRQPSNWQGIVLVLGILGINVRPDINTAILTQGGGSNGIGFAIPANVAKRIADEIIVGGEASHGLLGALVSDAMSSDDGAGFPIGVQVVEVTPGGAAELAGIKAGDIITRVNSKTVTTASELTAAVRQEPAGSTVKIALIRDDVQLFIDVVLQDAKE